MSYKTYKAHKSYKTHNSHKIKTRWNIQKIVQNMQACR